MVTRVTKIYDWIRATPLSRIVRIDMAVADTGIGELPDWINSSVSEIRMCPATILAVSRTDRVMGRIALLVSSIITISGIRALGVPRGTKCASVFLVFMMEKNMIELAQAEKAMGKFTEI